jgi:hypothetical protein
LREALLLAGNRAAKPSSPKCNQGADHEQKAESAV